MRISEKDCKPGSYCANPHADKINKTALWIVTILIVGVLVFPYVVPFLSAGGPEKQFVQTTRTVLDVRNMTCSSCVGTVRTSLTRLDGVKDVDVTLNPPRAVVVYDPQKIPTEDLIKATKRAGYPSEIRTDGGE